MNLRPRGAIICSLFLILVIFTTPAASIFRGYEKIEAKVKFAAVGDILIHDRVYNDAYNGQTFDFHEMLENAQELIEETDLAFANAESLIAGKELGLSGFPKFNSPIEVGYMTKELGFDIVNMANNHAMDQGEFGLKKAISNWENKIGMQYFGAYQNEMDQKRIRVVKSHGINIAFVGYTWSTNDIPIPQDAPYLINMAVAKNIQDDVQRAKTMADVVIVSLHYGQEYQRYPTHYMTNLVSEVVKAGPHVILGHHPHVLEPCKWITNDNGEKTFVIYSLGNFFSGQVGIYKQIGGVLYLDIVKVRKNGKSEYKIKNPEFKLTYVHHDKGNVNWKVHTLESREELRKEYIEMKEHMTQWMPELIVS